MKAAEYRKRFVAEAKNNVAEARKAYVRARKVAALGAKLAAAAEKVSGIAPYCFAGATGKVYVHVDLEVEGFKDKRLARVLEKGLNLLGDAAQVRSRDLADSNLRQYWIEIDGVQLEVNARLPEGDAMASCYRRQIGLKVVEVPQFEFVCN